jgi:hypothetical protein
VTTKDSLKCCIDFLSCLKYHTGLHINLNSGGQGASDVAVDKCFCDNSARHFNLNERLDHSWTSHIC